MFSGKGTHGRAHSRQTRPTFPSSSSPGLPANAQRAPQTLARLPKCSRGLLTAHRGPQLLASLPKRSAGSPNAHPHRPARWSCPRSIRTGQETSAKKFFPDPDLTYRLGWRHRRRWTCRSPSEPQPRGSCGLSGSDPAGCPPAHPTPAPTPPPPRRWQQRSRRVDASPLGAPALQPLLLPLQPRRPRKEGGAEA